jgi:predicted site-specific integrase-resolvase
LAVARVVSGIGSGMNGQPAQADSFLSDPGVSVVVVEHRDRLTRFGFEHVAAAWPGRVGGSLCWLSLRPPMIWCVM